MSILISEHLSRRLVKAGKRPLEGARSSEAASILEQPVQLGGFEALDGHTHALLVTYKRDGNGVPTPVWFARDGERVYVWTEVNAFKAKRLRRDPRALLAPCGPTGKPLGPPVAARGRILTGAADRDCAGRAVRAQWGFGRKLFERLSRPITEVHYLEFVPAKPDAESAVPPAP